MKRKANKRERKEKEKQQTTKKVENWRSSGRQITITTRTTVKVSGIIVVYFVFRLITQFCTLVDIKKRSRKKEQICSKNKEHIWQTLQQEQQQQPNIATRTKGQRLEQDEQARRSEIEKRLWRFSVCWSFFQTLVFSLSKRQKNGFCVCVCVRVCVLA